MRTPNTPFSSPQASYSSTTGKAMTLNGKLFYVTQHIDYAVQVDFVSEFLEAIDEAFSRALALKSACDLLKSMQDMF
jgi:hypothetical protein